MSATRVALVSDQRANAPSGHIVDAKAHGSGRGKGKFENAVWIEGVGREPRYRSTSTFRAHDRKLDGCADPAPRDEVSDDKRAP